MIAAFFIIGLSSSVFAGDVDPREMAIDLAVGGMEEGSRPLSPESGEDKIPGSELSPAMDTRVTASATGPNVSAPGGSANEPGGSATDSAGQGGDTSIIDVNADANLSGDQPTVDADATIDPNAGGEITTVGANLDDTTNGLEVGTTLETGSSDGGVSEPTGTEDRSIIEADAGIDTTGGSPAVNADASIDTSAEGGLVDADATTNADVVDQELTSDSGLQIDLGDSTTIAESSLGSEIGTSPAPAAAEADAGLEVDVEGTGSGDDVSVDPAVGLSAGL